MTLLANIAFLATTALAVSGCSTPPPVAMKASELPKEFTAPIPSGARQTITTEWWKSLSSPELTGLIAEANSGNLDLQAAAARVLHAQANTGAAAAALFPDVSLQGSARRQGSKAPGTNFNSFGLSLAASYEVDFWGAAQDNLRAARNNARAAIFDNDLVKLTTEASVADTYFSVLALRERMAIAKRNVDVAKRILAITQAKAANGVISNLELAQQTSQLASVEARIPALEEQERESRYALAILLGRVPEGFTVNADSLTGIQVPTVEAGLPSALLQRRPDIAEAEANLLAAHANLDAARAAFLPAINLSGNGGYSGLALSNLINPANLGWSVGTSLMQAIFDGGRLTSQRDAARAQEMLSVANYRSSVLNALSDVESALGSVSSLNEQERLTNEATSNAAEAFRISELQYREGVVDLLTVLQTQQTLFQDQDQLVQIKLARLQAGVGLYRALGGGWNVARDVRTRNDFVPVPDLTDLPVGVHL